MKINFNLPVLDKNGKPFGFDTPCLVVNEKMEFIYDSNGIPMQATKTDNAIQKKMIDVALDSLVTEIPKQNETPNQKKRIERYELFKKIRDAKKKGGLIVDLTAEECVLLKEVVGDCQAVLVYGQFVDLIDGKTEEVEEEKPLKKVK